MSENKKKGWPKWLLAVAVLGFPMLFLVPYWTEVNEEFGAYDAYLDQTLNDPANPPVWQTQALTPVECVDQGIAWVEACPGERQFCKGTVTTVVGQCMESQDRTGWCESLDRAWMTTGFGYRDCEDRLEGLERGPAKRRESVCASAYRSLANHCRDLDLAASTAGG